ncbi:hypothetical protein PCASD_23235 [Puccinia coronata f. sp. avenae]|uniref:Uncharacterized protein n=1 Tax=Puccinia coronata f. sp. avenae TaxID=200324 RepID=A0A2N5S5B6_9BASI|nr:hypothetical protein PCASD_23235 [Puccinia coronata f. sp. avenae]
MAVYIEGVNLPSDPPQVTLKSIFSGVVPRGLTGGRRRCAGWYKRVPARQGRRHYFSASRYRLAPARQGIAPRRAGTSLYLLGKELFLAEQVQACTGSPRSYSAASRYWLAPSRRGIAPWRAGTNLYQLGEELFLGEPVQAARREQRRRPPVKPRVGAVLPDFFTNAQ